eukprot:3361102-Rhodomonas_salina.1
MIGADTMTMRPRGHGSPPATAGARRAEFPNQYLGQGDAEDTSAGNASPQCEPRDGVVIGSCTVD